MPEAFFRISHHMDGSIDFVDVGDALVRIRVYWPFDTSTDEWISLSVDVDRSALTRVLADVVDAQSATSGEVRGPSGDTLTVKSRQADKIEFDLVDEGIKPPKRFLVDLPLIEIKDLYSAVIAERV